MTPATTPPPVAERTAPALDLRLLPTAGVARLIGEALLDLLLLPPRLLLAAVTCASRKRVIAELVRAKGQRAA